MKHSLLFCGLLILGMACKQGNKQPEATQDNGSLLVNCELLGKRLIPIDTAWLWIENYNRFRDSLQYKETGDGGPRPVDNNALSTAFTFQTMDLLSALNIPVDANTIQSTHVRGYLGKDSHGNSKMLVVGVQGANTIEANKMSAGVNMFFKCNAGQHANSNDGELYALDLNYPCPNLCPDGFYPNNGQKKK